jgi:CelD/BcsL family acetyltransferase involved in cellulose biosynthesis
MSEDFCARHPMVSKAKAREAVIEAARLYGRQVADLSMSLVTAAGTEGTIEASIAVVSQRIAKQIKQLTDRGMPEDLAELWIAAASDGATETQKELSPLLKGPRPSMH